MKKSFEIESDCLEIIRRIQEIDKDYFVKFCIDDHTFELHHRTQYGGTFCLTFPFDALDERCVDYVRKTQAQNSEKLFAEMEKENELLRKRQEKEVLKDFEEKFYDT